MLIQQTLDTLSRLKLTGMATALSEQRTNAAVQSLSFEERIGLIVDREALHRENRRLARLLKTAQLKQKACIEDIDYAARRGLDKGQMAHLAGSDWIRFQQNLILTGPTGCGKTWIACALGNQACRQGLSVLYVRVPRLFDELKVAHADGSFRKRLAAFAKADLLILDDWGLAPLVQCERNDLLEMIDDRANTRSTIITSQLPVEHWHEYIGEPTLADAILDRVLHSAHKIQLQGDSMRKKNRNLTQTAHPET